MNVNFRTRAKGQTMPIIGLLLAAGVLIGLVAIAIDGGSALLQRRTMQNGAEAGALAAVSLMSQNVLQSCSPTPCHPSYLLTNLSVYNEIAALTGYNRGGAVGATAASYGLTFGYHYMLLSPQCPGPDGPSCYRQSANDLSLVPPYVDGVVVTNTIANPTTFAKALPAKIVGTQLTSITVRANAAARIYPTCPAQIAEGTTLPFTRFRPALEYEMQVNANDPNSPFPLWQSQADIGGMNNWKNLLTLTEYSNFQTGASTLLVGDNRNGPPPPMPPDGGLCEYPDCGANPNSDCINAPCADLRGASSTDVKDVQNWIFWQFRGVISTTRSYDPSTSTTPFRFTRWPSDSGNNYGRSGSTTERLGDWAERGPSGNHGNNIHDAVQDMVHEFGVTTPLTALGYGKAITETIFVWGEPWVSGASTYNDGGKSGQRHTTRTYPCPPPTNTCTEEVWEDRHITGSGSPPSFDCTDCNGNNDIERFHFTKTYQFVFYENRLGGNSSEVDGYIVGPYLPGPNPGTCTPGWQPGGGVYSRQVSPP